MIPFWEDSLTPPRLEGRRSSGGPRRDRPYRPLEVGAAWPNHRRFHTIRTYKCLQDPNEPCVCRSRCLRMLIRGRGETDWYEVILSAFIWAAEAPFTSPSTPILVSYSQYGGAASEDISRGRDLFSFFRSSFSVVSLSLPSLRMILLCRTMFCRILGGNDDSHLRIRRGGHGCVHLCVEWCLDNVVGDKTRRFISPCVDILLETQDIIHKSFFSLSVKIL